MDRQQESANGQPLSARDAYIHDLYYETDSHHIVNGASHNYNTGGWHHHHGPNDDDILIHQHDYINYDHVHDLDYTDHNGRITYDYYHTADHNHTDRTA